MAKRSPDGTVTCLDGPHASRFTDHSALAWPDRWMRHDHHHHRFERQPEGAGAEVEASRGCPYSCTFCAKLAYRDSYRRRDLEPLLEEIDRLIAQGTRYVYFIDEIFLPQPTLLEALVERNIAFGVQTRIDLWKPALLELLGRAGCVSIEAGVESLTEAGRAELAKRCAMTTAELTERLIIARRHVPSSRPISSASLATMPPRWRPGGGRFRNTASGPMIRCRSIPIRLPPTIRSCRAGPTTSPGNGRMITICAASRASATSRISGRQDRGTRGCVMAAVSGERLKVLMTADSVGGVALCHGPVHGGEGTWRRADHCRPGPRPHAIQEREAFRAGIKMVWLDAQLDWVAPGPSALEQAARLLDRVIDDFRPDVLHLNTGPGASRPPGSAVRCDAPFLPRKLVGGSPRHGAADGVGMEPRSSRKRIAGGEPGGGADPGFRRRDQRDLWATPASQRRP